MAGSGSARTRRPGAGRLIGFTLAGVLALGAGFAAGGGGFAVAAPAFAGEAQELAPKTLGAVRETPVEAAAAEPVRTCSIEDVASAAGALDFHGVVVDTQSGETVYERKATDAVPTASVMKLLTTTAAIEVLGPDFRIPTRVYAGSEPGTVVIVGGGDVTLASTDSGAGSYYSGATGTLADLAAQTRTAWANDPSLSGTAPTQVLVDESAFSGAEWQPSWSQADRTDGYISPISALMVDGGRQDPASLVSPRTEDPSGAAAAAFATRLGAATTGASGSAPDGAKLLAEVWSQPVSELVHYALIDSDNNVAETLARLVAIEQGIGTDFGAIQDSTSQALTTLGLDTSGLVLADGSGLSADNRVPPELVAELLQTISQPDIAASQLLDDLPASGQTGTLQSRLTPLGVPPGAITAKTGWINEVYGLAGYLTAADGSRLTFAFFVVGTVTPANRDALDTIAARTYSCGASLANW
ncbi:MULTISPECIES: D-alanyl-D-alanine carboxypeptidase/D-alanyl-D-alanine endopeptidase [unclassified Pseudoclavibacter]|uniref:D-alanyl-D-alanine carboxypeptidase/D-alanyl-D-alanine endopeptidase n=1 Tax=unclassified Pseudoclavibacter TaxID=2615177 RepID=UPI001BAA4B3F|nr:D-alanyl-D-alanine carboxypeptidase/D-alanyl-D-alanine-endopeptidase [Pseudoclavibacter sp. Marseille-Q4354]MBS3178587.1 D-alanyl-D-alanine carboxypeptidase/D-alanyl-D-alanine-endopeptidase [Pseudoclavibacter sp. Marseille-Q4354]